MSKNIGECWSTDQEDFNCDSLGELIDSSAGDLEPGMIVYVGDAVHPSPGDFIDADDIITMLGERASDLCGEYAEDFPDVTKEAEKELTDFIAAWVEKHAAITFYQVKNVKPYTLTKNDFGDDREPLAELP